MDDVGDVGDVGDVDVTNGAGTGVSRGFGSGAVDLGVGGDRCISSLVCASCVS